MGEAEGGGETRGFLDQSRTGGWGWDLARSRMERGELNVTRGKHREHAKPPVVQYGKA